MPLPADRDARFARPATGAAGNGRKPPQIAALLSRAEADGRAARALEGPLPYARRLRAAEAELHDPPLLFHLEIDPSEKYNVAKDHADVIADIRKLVAEHMEGLVAPPSQLELR